MSAHTVGYGARDYRVLELCYLIGTGDSVAVEYEEVVVPFDQRESVVESAGSGSGDSWGAYIVDVERGELLGTVDDPDVRAGELRRKRCGVVIGVVHDHVDDVGKT